eukprot:gene20996-27854_t
MLNLDYVVSKLNLTCGSLSSFITEINISSDDISLAYCPYAISSAQRLSFKCSDHS